MGVHILVFPHLSLSKCGTPRQRIGSGPAVTADAYYKIPSPSRQLSNTTQVKHGFPNCEPNRFPKVTHMTRVPYMDPDGHMRV